MLSVKDIFLMAFPALKQTSELWSNNEKIGQILGMSTVLVIISIKLETRFLQNYFFEVVAFVGTMHTSQIKYELNKLVFLISSPYL